MRKALVLIFACAVTAAAQCNAPYGKVGPQPGQGTTCIPTGISSGGSGGSMTWPATPGVSVCTGTPCTAWGTSITGLSQTLVGYIANVTSDVQAQLNAKQATLSAYSTISGLSGYPTSFPPVVMTTGAADPTANCTAPSASNLALYTQTTDHTLWACVATNTWQKILSTANIGPYTLSATPGTFSTGVAGSRPACSASSYYLATDTHELTACDGTNWSAALNASTWGCIFNSTASQVQCYDTVANLGAPLKFGDAVSGASSLHVGDAGKITVVSAEGAIEPSGVLQTSSGVTAQGMAYPAVTVTQGGTPGTSVYNYCVSGTDATSAMRTVCASTSTSAVPLSGSNYNIFTVPAWSSTAPYVAPVGSCNVYRTTDGTIATAAVGSSGGTNWQVNDTFNITLATGVSSDGNSIATGKVLSLSGNSVDTFQIVTAGWNYTVANGYATVASGASTGSGLVVNVTAVLGKGLIGTIASCASGGNLHDTGLAGNGAAPPKNTSGLVTAVGSGPIVYASQFGCALNSNIDTGGGTDDTACLQNAINALSNQGGGTLVIDGTALISAANVSFPTQTTALVLKTNVTLQGVPGQGLFVAPGSNVTPIGNRLSGTTTADTNIGVVGLTINGNGANQAKCELNDCATAGHEWVFGIWFSGADTVVLRDVTVRNAKTFAFLFSNDTNIHGRNLKATWDGGWSGTPAGWPLNNHNWDGLHFLGNVSDSTFDGFWHNGDDDAVAFNTDELGIAGADARRGTGAILSNLTVQNVFLYGAQGVRLWGNGTGVMHNISLQNFYGAIISHVMICGGTGSPPFTATGISIAGWHVGGSYNGIAVCNTTGVNLSNIISGAAVTLTSNTAPFTGDYFGVNGAGGSISDNFTNLTFTGRHLLFSADNLYDIGASGATRPRYGYFGTALFSPSFIQGSALTGTLGPYGFQAAATWGIRWESTSNSTDASFDVALGRNAKGLVEVFNGSVNLYDPAHYWAGLKAGTFAAQALANPVITSVTPSGNNGVTCTYTVTGYLADGVTATAPSATSSAAGPTNCNSNTIVWSHVAGTSFYAVARTVGGASQGIITATVNWAYNPTHCPAGVCTYIDTGTAASGSAPTTNTTGTYFAGTSPGVTASGVSCAITAITGGIITGATCP